MDDLDRRLIGLLRDNARLPMASLAQHLGVSRGTVQNRLDKLLSQGEILGFTVRMRSEETIAGVRAITLISEQTKNTSAVLKALRQIPEAKAIHTTNGRWDIMVEMAADDLTALDTALTLIRRIEGVVSTETLILLTQFKS
ncbi:MAG: Lrp/AsnC family transcriptional regulator [Alphaproteobacteria bacterium]